ncbi:MAG: site-2 protease family protein [Anaerolineales bacterium]
MDSSLSLFRVRGIAIRVHITFPLILIWSAIQFGVLAGRGLQGAIFGVVVTLLLFAIVVLHELGHSVVALHYGVPVKQIVLLPIGGVAQVERIPEQPRQEFMIAIAGPLVNFALAIVLGLAALAAGQSLGLERLALALSGLGSANLSGVFAYVFASNIFIGLFNLLPAFPMDGGRVLRALLATRLDYGRATSIAVFVGQTLAWVLGLWGFLGGGFFLILIAVFIYIGAGQEGRMVQVRRVLKGINVGQVYSRQARTLRPESTLAEAVEVTLNSFQSDFPICDGERLVGLLTHTRLIEALQNHAPGTPMARIMLPGVEPVSPQEGLYLVQQRMAKDRIDALPVVEEGRFVGLITNRDINEAYLIVSSQPQVVGSDRTQWTPVEELGEAA